MVNTTSSSVCGFVLLVRVLLARVLPVHVLLVHVLLVRVLPIHALPVHVLLVRVLLVQSSFHMYPYFLFAAIHHLKSSPTFSVRPCSSVGTVTVDLIRRSWVRFPPRSKDFFFTSCGSLIPFTRANAQWVIHGLSSTIIYTSELILCSTTSFY